MIDFIEDSVPTILKKSFVMQKRFYSIQDINFCKENDDPIEYVFDIIHYLRIRPFSMDKVIEACSIFVNMPEFNAIRAFFIHYTISNCPILLRHLCNRGFFTILEIMNELNRKKNSKLCIFFIKLIPKFLKFILTFHSYWDTRYMYLWLSDIDSNDLKDYLIHCYTSSSSEFKIKYDLNNELGQTIKASDPFKISIFEFSTLTECSNIEASAYFGSIKCFRMLFLQNNEFSGQLIINAIIGGNPLIIHEFQINTNYIPQYLYYSSLSFRNDIFEWLYEQNEISDFDPYPSNISILLHFMGAARTKNLNSNPINVYMDAIKNGDHRILELFLQKQFDPFKTDLLIDHFKGIPLITYFALYGYAHCVGILVKYGTFIDTIDSIRLFFME